MPRVFPFGVVVIVSVFGGCREKGNLVYYTGVRVVFFLRLLFCGKERCQFSPRVLRRLFSRVWRASGFKNQKNSSTYAFYVLLFTSFCTELPMRYAVVYTSWSNFLKSTLTLLTPIVETALRALFGLTNQPMTSFFRLKQARVQPAFSAFSLNTSG